MNPPSRISIVSPLASRLESGINSMMSNISSGSREQESTEIMTRIAQVAGLVKDDEWYNIPAPVRECCEGLIRFTQDTTTRILKNANGAHSKINAIDDRTRKLENSTKQSLKTTDATLARELKRTTTMIEKFKEQQKIFQTTMGEQQLKSRQQLGLIDDKLLDWETRFKKFKDKVGEDEDCIQELEVSFADH